MIRIEIRGATAVASRLIMVGAEVEDRASRSVVHHGHLLSTRVKAKASGRPGPNAPTGDYRRSIGVRVQRTPTHTTATVGTNKPQGRRLEYGFTGRDSLNRYYNQPPYEHFGPAFDEISQDFFADQQRIINRTTL